MDRLTAADAWFLYLEGPTVPLHVTGLLLLDPATAPAGFSFEELAQVVGAFAAAPLDRSQPLWELVVMEGLADGRVALAMKLHHCLVDGVSGLDVMAKLLDLAPEGSAARSVAGWRPDRLPSAVQVVAAAAWNRVTDPLRPARAAVGVASSLVQLAGTSIRRRVGGADSVAHPVNAPRTPFNASVSAARAVAFGRVPLHDLTTIKRAFDSTINDVVLAACAHGLRAHLAAHDALPDRPLVCSVPVSTHRHDVSDRSMNQVSSMFVHLPVQLPDPLDSLLAGILDGVSVLLDAARAAA